ncbi:MAG: hypothetical protein HON81_04185, partial [Verrucomicrobia bacterium]|nr:hypothetical protein [Verrucomicrobiota bacterium]
MTIPRPEHPSPQLERSTWLNLNGTWSYEFDFGNSGDNRELFNSKGFSGEITVPFCPESELSGVAHHDFIPAIWYHRSITIPKDWDGLNVRINCGAIDYESTIYLNGTFIGRHFGGSSSFSFDLTPHVKAGETFDLVIHAIDDTRNPVQPRGKQSFNYYSRGCSYTRTTGIWQTVWLEAHAPSAIERLQVLTDIDNGTLTLFPQYFNNPSQGTEVNVSIKDHTGVIAKSQSIASQHSGIQLCIPEVRLWSPDDPHLYDLEIEVSQKGEVVDAVSSYVGMRKVHIEENQVYLNNQPLFQRLVLDQGFYKKGIWTAPSDGDLRKDIELSMQAGFNGARLHQKVFEERFHYWADKLGYLTWAESPSWGLDNCSPESQRYFLTEWSELVTRDRNHPSIIAWSPLNETSSPQTRQPTFMKQHKRFHCDLYDLTRTLDPTRHVNDASGFLHHKTDLWTVHCYDQDPEKLKEKLTPTEDDGV